MPIYTISADPPRIIPIEINDLTDTWISENRITGFFEDPENAKNELFMKKIEYRIKTR